MALSYIEILQGGYEPEISHKDIKLPVSELATILNYNGFYELKDVSLDRFSRRLQSFNLLQAYGVFGQNDAIYSSGFAHNGQDENLFLLTQLKDSFGVISNKYIKVRKVVKNNTIFKSMLDRGHYRINTLQCLFGNEGISAQLESGNIVNFTSSRTQYKPDDCICSFIVNDKLTIYEYESLIRNLSLIKHVADQGKVDDIVISMPKITYYFYGVLLYERGVLETELLLKYFDIIDSRVRKIEDIFAKRFPNLTRVFNGPLNQIEDYIRQCVHNGRFTKIDEILAILNEDYVWRSVLAIKQVTRKEQLYEGLCESVEEIRTSVEGDGRLGIIIKNPKEERTLVECNNFVRKFSRICGLDFSLLGLYQLELIDLGGSDDVKSLYHLQGANFCRHKKLILEGSLLNVDKYEQYQNMTLS